MTILSIRDEIANLALAQTFLRKGRDRAAALVCIALVALAFGCANSPIEVPANPVQGALFSGNVKGGKQAIAGARMQLYAAGTSGDMSNATALLGVTVTTSDGSGNGTNSNANAGNGYNSLPVGSFTITGEYVCPSASSEMYLVATGGSSRVGIGASNPNLALMATLGPCGSLGSGTIVSVNEITTVGAVAALSGFMTRYTNLGSGSVDLTQLEAAFSLVNQFVDIAQGVTPGPSVPKGYTVPTDEIQKLADVIANCVNSDGGIANDGSACGQLFAYTTVLKSSPPTNTIEALINIVNNPNSNVSPIFGLSSAAAPFKPALTKAPSSWAVVAGNLSPPTTPVTPLVFNSTESALPGDVIYLQGDDFGSSPTVYFYNVGGNESSLASPTTLGATLLTPVTASNTAITVQIPSHVPLSLYAIWVSVGSSVYSAPVMINQADPLQFEYHDISSNYTFRIFGRNLALPGATPTVTFSGLGAATVVTTYPNDSNILQVTAPSGVVNGTAYTITVSNGYGHGTGNYDVATAPQQITGLVGPATCSGVTVTTQDIFGLNTPWGASFACVGLSVVNVVTSINPHTGVAYGADSSGSTNSVNAIQQALYDAGNTALYPNGATVLLPAGTYLVNQTGENTSFYGITGTIITQPALTTLVAPSGVVIEGVVSGGTIQSTLTDATTVTTANRTSIRWTSSATLTGGITNLNFTETGILPTGGYLSPIISLLGTKAFASNVNMQFAHNTGTTAEGGNFGMVGNNVYDVLMQNVTSDYGRIQAFAPNSTASYVTLRNNVFTHHGGYNITRVEISQVSNMLIEGNTFTRDGLWPAGSSAYEQGQLDGGGLPYVVSVAAWPSGL